jgi:hypothetical protein
LALVAVGVFAVGGCTDATAGSPIATTARQPPTSTLSDAVDPCALLTSRDVQQLGLVPTGRDTAAGGRDCHWKKSGQYVVGIEIWDNRSLSDLSTINRVVTNYPVGSHEGRQVLSHDGGCGVYLALTATSMVVASGAGVMSADECPLADQLAKLIEPRLPKG